MTAKGTAASRRLGQPRASSRLPCSRAGHIFYRYISSTAFIHDTVAPALRGFHNSVRCASSGFQDPNVREAAKRLSAIFYKDVKIPDAADGNSQSSTAPSQPETAHLGQSDIGDAAHAGDTSDPNLNASTTTATSYPNKARALPSTPPPPLDDLALWRADSVVLVGQQALLHVHTPHYVHMFGRLFASRDRPWFFGHVRLPAGSRNLGAPEWALCASGSRAPTVGVLMEVNRAVRLEDGKLMVLATALCRIQVRECLSETPYSRARVEVLHEDELLESLNGAALLAALGSGGGVGQVAPTAAAADEPEASSGSPAAAASAVAAAVECSTPRDMLRGICNSPTNSGGVGALLQVAAAAAQAAATAAGWRWLDYEVFAARAAAWPGRCPVEGADPHDTRRLVWELVDHGVLTVVPFGDGPVVGRWDLAALGDAAAANAAAAAAVNLHVTEHMASGRQGGEATCDMAVPPPTSATGGGDSSGVAEVNGGCAADGPVQQLPGLGTGAASLPPTPSGTDSAPNPASGPRAEEGLGGSGPADSNARTFSAEGEVAEEGLTGHTTYDLLLLESKLWGELDAMAVLQARAHQQRLGLPLGLLQLRPSDELAAQQLAAAAPPSVVCQRQGKCPGPPENAGLGRDVCSAESGLGAGTMHGIKSTTPVHVRGTDFQERNSSPVDGSGLAAATLPPQPEGPSQPGTAQPRVHPASEGLDVYAHPDYPLERRIMRLSYAAASIFVEAQDSAARQELLEMPSVRARLQDVLRRARKARSILAAMAAVKTLKRGQSGL